MPSYFVSYVFYPKPYIYMSGGFGRCSVYLEQPITGINDIEKIEHMLSKDKPGTDITILYWKEIENV